MKIVTQNIENYLSKQPIIRLYVFGSYARNEQTENSDIDLLIEIDSNSKVDLFDFIGWQWDLEKMTGKKIDLVSADSVSPFIKPYIDNDKILIYEKQ